MKMGGRVRADQRGFTLAELLVAIAILGLVMGGILTLLMTGNQSYLTGSNQAEAQATIRAALERITLDIREAGYGPTTDQNCTAPNVPSGCFNAVINPTVTSFTLQSDWNGSGAIQVPCPAPTCDINYVFGGVNTAVRRGEQVTYTVVGGNLCRQESDIPVVPPDPLCPAGFVSLVTSVQQASVGGVLQRFFQYVDANGQDMTAAAAASPWLIRTIWVQVVVGVQNQPPAIWQTGRVQVTMSDRIRLRNRI